MVSKDFKSLLKKYAKDLFDLHYTLKAMTYSPARAPIIRYSRAGTACDFEMYWSNENPPAPLEIVWGSHYHTHTLRLDGRIKSWLTNTSVPPLPTPPMEVQQRALALLQELNSKRELVALYRCGYIKDNIFTLSGWPIPFPADYKPDDGEDGCLYYTITLGGTLGVAGCYAANYEELCTALL